MDAGKAQVTVRQATAAETRPFVDLAAIHARQGEGGLVAELLARGQCFVVERDGEALAGYVLRPVGAELFVTAAGGRADVDLCDVLDAIVSEQAAQFDSIAFKTTRPGLVRKAQRRGYEIDAYIMRKKIK